MFSSCFAASTSQAPPPKIDMKGIAPLAAILPIENTNDKEISDQVTIKLEECLESRNAFKFVDQADVDNAINELGFDMSKIFGLSNKEYKALADKLGVDYTIHGVVTVKKTLTFAGWRRDVDLYIYLNEAGTGKKVDSWRSMTEFAFGKTQTVIDGSKMAEAATNHICTKMLERRF